MKALLLSVLASLSVSAFAKGQVSPPTDLSKLPSVIETWGGENLNLEVLSNHAVILGFGCGRGDIPAGKWPPNQSRVEATGTITHHTGVRPPAGYKAPSNKATFAANIDYAKETMSLTIKEIVKVKQPNGKTTTKEEVNTYKLQKDKYVELKRCMAPPPPPRLHP